jgi:hypothetical protein
MFVNEFPSTQTFRAKIISSNHITNTNYLDGHDFPNDICSQALRGVVLVLVSPLLTQLLLTLPLEAKLTLVTISPTIVTMKSHEFRFRLGLGLLTWFLFWFLLTRFFSLLPNELIPQVTLELMGFWKSFVW